MTVLHPPRRHGTDKISGEAELGVAHQVRVFFKIIQAFAQFVGLVGSMPKADDAGVGLFQDVFDAPHVQQVAPSPLLSIIEAERFGQVREVFACVVEINDVSGSGKVGRSDGFVVTDSVGEDDDFACVLATPSDRFLINVQTEKLAGVGRRARPVGEPLSFEKMVVTPVGFNSTVKREENGWSISAKIPAAVLGLERIEPGMLLRLAFARYDASSGREPVLSTSASHPVISFHRPDEWSSVVLR